ncbi:hypothetical protein BDV93DRAFT_78159 [Ceratobasidium sp. AG-I]|nr:hypothetical protein BDV93DRAFT_78159 [Ceratobasidium sp. AG-I]
MTLVGAAMVDEILRASGAVDLPHLVGTLWSGDTRALRGEGPGRMFLRPTSASSPTRFANPKSGRDMTEEYTTIYTSPRIGPDLSGISSPSRVTASNPRVQYLIRPYRFFRLPHLLGSLSPQTVYGLLASGLSHAQIVSLVDGELSTVERMVEHLEEGRKAGSGALKILIGREGWKSARTPQGSMNIIGLVESTLRQRMEWEREGRTRNQATVEFVPRGMVGDELPTHKINTTHIFFYSFSR